jgi:nucleotide-binding universal stress UspA family protein
MTAGEKKGKEKKPATDAAAKKEEGEGAGRAAQNYRKILVGYDGSNNSARALARASLLAATNGGASLRIVVVVNTMVSSYGPTPPYYPENYFELMFEDGNKLLDQALVRCRSLGDKASGLVEEGHPAETILEVAKREEVDLIVIGRRGISGVQRFLMGGVSSSVVGHSICDVLVVK